MNQLKAIALSVLTILLLTTFSCKEIECSFQEDQDIIKSYLTANGLTAQMTTSGLHYIIEKEGIGSRYPGFNTVVSVKYKGYFTDGTVFDESPAGGTKFTLSNVIAGWQEGIAKLKKEGKGVFLIPSSLAYGTRPVGGLEGRECSVIIFDVTLDDFQ